MHKRNGVKKCKNECLAIAISGLLLLLLIIGCSSSPQQAPFLTTPPTQSAPTDAPTPSATICTTKECFISSANDCNDIDLTLTEDAGVLKYSSSKDCLFTKTLVSLNPNETQEMKNLLEGKSLTCKYEKGTFDQRWANSLIFGSEYCEGELKDILVELLVFG